MSLEEAFTSKIKIIKALRRAGEPLIAQHIAKRSRLSPQLVSYHLQQMVEWGMIIISTSEDKTFYHLQKAYCDEELLGILSDMLIPYMALAESPSTLLTRDVSEHLETNVWLAEKMLKVRFNIQKINNLFRIEKSS